MNFFNSVTGWIKRYFFSTNHKGIGMLYTICCINFSGFIKRQKSKLTDQEGNFQTFENFPFVFIFWGLASVVSFSLAFTAVQLEILPNPFSITSSNEIPFEDVIENGFGSNSTPLEPKGIFRNYQTVVAGQIFEYDDILRYNDNQIIVAQNQGVAYASNGVLCLGYEGFVNFENYYAYLNRLGTAAIEYDCRYYGNYKVIMSLEFQMLFDRFLETGYFGTIDLFSDSVNSDIEEVEESFQDYRANYNRLGILSEIADQQLAIIMNYAETSLEKIKAQNVAIVNKGYKDLVPLLKNRDFVNANKVMVQIRDSLMDVSVQTYHTSVEMTVFFGNLLIHCQEVGPAVKMTEMSEFFANLVDIYRREGIALDNTPVVETPFVEAGNRLLDYQRLRVPRVIDKKTLCDCVYCPKE